MFSSYDELFCGSIFKSPQDYEITIYNRLRKSFFTKPYKAVSELPYNSLNAYAKDLGVDTIVNFVILENTTILKHTKNIWVSIDKCVVSDLKRFVFVLFESGDYMILRKEDFKEITDVKFHTSKLFKFGTNPEDLLLLKNSKGFDKEFYGIHVTPTRFNHKIFFEIIFREALQSRIDNPYNFNVLKRFMFKRMNLLYEYLNDVAIWHSSTDSELLYRIINNILKDNERYLKDEYLMEYVFSKQPTIFNWTTTDNKSEYSNMFAIECPIIGDKEKAIANIKNHSKDIARYCRHLLQTSAITTNIYNFLKFDRSVYTNDGRLMMYYCFKNDEIIEE